MPVADRDTIVIIDDNREDVDWTLQMVAGIEAAKRFRLMAFTDDAAAREFVAREATTIQGFIRDLNRAVGGRLTVDGLVFLEHVIRQVTPWARTIIHSGYANRNIVKRVFEIGGGNVDFIEKGSPNQDWRHAILWLISPCETFNDTSARDIAILHVLEPAWNEVCRALSAKPTLLHQLEPRAFEKLVAEIFRSCGWHVELTATTRDGGYDIIAVRSLAPTSVRLLVEAKRFAPDRPVGVNIIRALYGIKAANAVSQVVLATTSHVSRDARKEFAHVVPWELDFLERDAILSWCRNYGTVNFSGVFNTPQVV